MKIFLEVIKQDDNYFIIKDFKIKSQQNTSSKSSILGRLSILEKLYNNSKDDIIKMLKYIKDEDDF